ncbi:hypothetical protein OK074_6379 [Actinobacteria bacterium OK074]|nr:hypothetical protein OK074_6379 [Actinobacteria bacterium OK074]
MNTAADHLNRLDLGPIRQSGVYAEPAAPIVSVAAAAVAVPVGGAVAGVATAFVASAIDAAQGDACFDAADGGAGVCG